MLVVHADEQVTTEPMFNPSLTVFEKVEGGGGQGEVLPSMLMREREIDNTMTLTW